MRYGAPSERTSAWRERLTVRDPRYILNASHFEKEPACFNSESQYKEYLQLKRISGEAHLYRGVCADCTPEFKEQMLTEGRCEHPETVFVQVFNFAGEPETVGVADNHKWWPKVKKGQMIFRTTKEKRDPHILYLDDFLKELNGKNK